MNYEYDFTLEVDYPKSAIDPLCELIYQHGTKVLGSEELYEPTVDDEVDVMATLFGVARLTEVNIRIAWQDFCAKESKAENSNPRSYSDVLKLIGKNFVDEPAHWLYQNALTVADGMLHGNFYQAYTQSKKAYERSDLGLTQDSFIAQRIALVTTNGTDLNFDSSTGVVTTSSGAQYPHKSYIPSKSKSIENNFVSFYASAAFVSVFDVLFSSFNKAFHFRKCIAGALPVTQNT